MDNEIVVQSIPFNRCKGRWWVATRHGHVLGEFRAYQDSVYQRAPDGTGYGRGGGRYSSKMIRESWCEHLGEDPEHTSDRTFNQWKAALRELSSTVVRAVRVHA